LGSIIGLIPTQGMNGNEPLAQMLGFFALFFMAVYAVTSGLGFSALRGQPNGSKLWRHSVVGFVTGAGLAGLSVTVALRSIALKWPDVLQLLYFSPFVFPPVGGLIAIVRFRKPEE
jgi:hypothetical protein